MKRGDVVIVDFPFSNKSGSKVRPALVVQSDIYNRRLQSTIIALISSSRARFVGAKCQLPIDILTPEGRNTGLWLPSIVLCENLITLDHSLIIKVIGEFSPAKMRDIDTCLKDALGVAN